jgi:voltage-gated potassium channel Kch
VRIAARSRGARPSVTALVVGVLALLSLAIPYSAPQVILGAAAVALGLVAVERGDNGRGATLGRAGIALGSLVIATWTTFMGFAIATGDWPVGGG